MSGSISEEFNKRLQDKPDKFTIAWWDEQFKEVLRAYRGANHGINQVLAYNEDLSKANQELLNRVTALEAAGESDRAKIGELQLRLDGQAEIIGQIHARVEKMAEFLNQLKQKKEKP